MKIEDVFRDFDGFFSFVVCYGVFMSLMVDIRFVLRRGGWEERGWGW